MKAWLFLALWLAVGLWLARQGERSPAERALALFFWPFFLGQGDEEPPPPSPLERLRTALGERDLAGQAIAEELERALDRLRAKLARVEGALAELPREGEGAVAQARAASRKLLESARQRHRRDLDAALAAMEEAATRLHLAQDASERGAVDALLRSLKDRLLAEEEVGATGVQGGG